MPAFTAPVAGWLLQCFLLSAFIISCRQTTVNACCWPLLPPIVIHRRHRRRRRCRCLQAATTVTATTVVKLTLVHCQRKRQQQHRNQHTNGSTNVKTLTSPDNLDLFNLSTVFEVCDVG
jgi:hypothetical protein